MTTPDWVQDAIFYQIFPDRFARSKRMPDPGFEPWDSSPTVEGFKGGDLYGVAERLDYLQDLGITAIYLNPIFTSASNHRYHTFDYYTVDPLLGGNAAFRQLLDTAHKRKMRIVVDGVFNHASRGFWQFHHVLETGAASPYKDWFHFDPDRLHGRKHWGAYPSTQEVQAIQTEGSFKAIGYQGWWNLPALPKFNTNTPAVREFLFGVAEHWIRFGIDGWRLDVPAEIDDDQFWREFRQRVRKINPEAYIVGEIWHEAQRWLQGDQFDAVMNYPLTCVLLNFFAGALLNIEIANEAGGLRGRIHRMDVRAFADEIERMLALYPREVTYAQLNLLNSHDTPRFISCAGGDQASLELAMLFLFTYPGSPCLLYGDEIGLVGRHDPDCRKSFQWDASKWNSSLYNQTRELISLRKSQPALRRGEYSRLYAAEGVYAFTRVLGKDQLWIALNTQDEPRRIELEASSKKPHALFGKPEGLTVEQKKYQFTILPRSGVVLR
jgi:cyclomaltodextrinase